MNLYVEIREEATRTAREVQRLKWDHTHTPRTHTHTHTHIKYGYTISLLFL